MDAAREPPEADEAARLEALRLAARAAYTLERRPVSLRELLGRPPFRGLSYRQVYGWYEDEGWAEERRLNAIAWREETAGAWLGHRPGQREREVAGLRRLLEEATWLRRQPTVRPKSWEAVAGVHIKTIELFRQWEREEREAQERQEELAMARQGQEVGDSPFGDMDDEEVRCVANYLLERRLALSRQGADLSSMEARHGEEEEAKAKAR